MSELCSVPRVSERFAQSNALDEDIARLKYVSGKREEALRRLGIRTVGDLLLHIPHRYLDFTRSWSIEMAPIGTVCTIVATVDRIVQKQPRPRMQVTEVSLVDETGVLQVAFFRQPWIAQQFKQGDRLAVMGKVEFAYGFKQMASPHFEKLEGGRAAGTILPVHYVSDGVSQAWMRRIVSGALEVIGNPFDPIPARLRVKRRLMSNARALRSIHFPSSMAERDIARARLAYEECLYLQLALRLRNDGGLVEVAPYAHAAGEHLAALKEALPFSLSDEQEAAFQDILHDMCDGGRVMNRLLLGDVGTGKTAVAACALAVAADSGTQSCVMAPTGVLARQYADKTGPLLSQAGMSWALLTGATPAAERDQIHAQLESGELDVLFGTHAVLSEDVNFKRLSLVVIDEQHRFGVGQRNALRAKGPGADLLVMTATPIPRTLEMAVTGIREMSTLATPPEDRLPVLTYVGAYEDAQVTAAVRRELLRGGQVFYVHNRVQDISSVAAKIHELVPESHVGIAHGKMGEKQLDGVIRDFWHRDIDVLVCTTIIETGLDISNANTLIVDHADRFGLSQLHQLRGRVGRGRERAYAYFLYDPTKPMTQQSHDRLATIAQNTALGSGFDVAMKDLELRGTGNLLGDEQSGHIEGVGFDLYVRMVSEAVEQYKEPERKESVAVTIDLPIEASIPVDYIDSDKLRLEAYQKLASARTEDDLDELRDELTDRYGKPPVDFEALFDVARLRFKARKLGISEIIAQGRNVRVSKFEPRESVQMRMARIYKGIQYRPLTKTYLVPAPFAGSLGSKPMSSDEVVGWTSQLLDDLDWKPTPRQ